MLSIARTCLAALLACAACSAGRPGSAGAPEQDGGWPVMRAAETPTADRIALACNVAEPRFERWIADPDVEMRGYAVRDPVCTTDRLRQGRTQCSFELGETRRKLFDDNDRAARRVRRWQTARVRLSYRRVGPEDEWMESWWADGPCRP